MADTGDRENEGGGETKKMRTFNTVTAVTVHSILFIYYLSTLWYTALFQKELFPRHYYVLSVKHIMFIHVSL